MVDLKDKLAIVTGATSGIGKAIALSLLNEGCRLILTGRDASKIKESILQNEQFQARVQFIPADLKNDKEINHLIETIHASNDRIDILIHSAGVIHLGSIATVPVESFDEQYKVNVRAPFVLTQAFLQKIIDCKGQMVFINSTAGLDSWAEVGQYAASKHAFRAWVNSLRAEISGSGVKLVNVFPGATDSPMQQRVQKLGNKAYRIEDFIPADQLADIVVKSLKVPDATMISDVVVKPLNYEPRRKSKIL